MSSIKNPFVELYVTEHYSADKFVQIFSPVLVEESETHALFQPGNVMLTGLQGAGKTALLNLLKPEVLIAYFKSDVDWPLPDHCAKFISAGINLSKSGAKDFGQRSIGEYDQSNNKIFALFFADFLNYWIVDDLLSTLETLCSSQDSEVSNFLSLGCTPDKLDKFARYVGSQKCWFGALDGVHKYRDLRSLVENRVTEYRSFLNYNSELSQKILNTKTSPGEPISIVASALKHCGLIPNDLPVFIRIDQFEDLMGLEKETEGTFSKHFRGIIMKMLGMRDDRVSYRIGARPYSFYPDFKMFGTASSAEEMRNFKVVDIGDLLRGHESRRSLFPKFCNDVFEKRLLSSGEKLPKSKTTAIGQVFGPRPKPSEKAEYYTKSKSARIIGASNDWPAGVRSFLFELAETNPLSAKLGEAWTRQKIEKGRISLTDIESLPWESLSRKWWKKERVQQALLQISSSRQQRMVWYGREDVVSLSGRNILVFLSICQFVFAEFLRAPEKELAKYPKGIRPIVQDMGIQEASAYWFRKVKADPSGGDDRHRFINILGTLLRTKLRDDKRMSYPGSNGFTLPDGELEKNRVVAEFLDLCDAYGVLETFKHTPKTKSRGQSHKWYLSSILTPYFQIPTPHTKEPLYTRIDDVLGWMKQADITVGTGKAVSKAKRQNNQDSSQLLFPFEGTSDE